MWGKKKQEPRRVRFNIVIPQCDNVFQVIGYVAMQQADNPLITREAFQDFQDDVMSNGLRVLPNWGIVCDN